MFKKCLVLTAVFLILFSSLAFALSGAAPRVAIDGSVEEWYGAPRLFDFDDTQHGWQYIDVVKYLPDLHNNRLHLKYYLKTSAMYSSSSYWWSSSNQRKFVDIWSDVYGENNQKYRLHIIYNQSGFVQFRVSDKWNNTLALDQYQQDRNSRHLEFYLPIDRMNSGNANGYFVKLYPEPKNGRYGIISTGSSGPILSSMIAVAFAVFYYHNRKKQQLNCLEGSMF